MNEWIVVKCIPMQKEDAHLTQLKKRWQSAYQKMVVEELNAETVNNLDLEQMFDYLINGKLPKGVE